MTGSGAIAVHSCVDARLLSTLHGSCFEEGWSEASLAAMISTPGVHALVAFGCDGVPRGFAVLRCAADEAEIIAIGVEAGSRRRGLGSALLAAGVDACRAQGAASLFLEVAADNAAARRFYESASFTPAGVRKGYYARAGEPAVDAIALVLRLT